MPYLPAVDAGRIVASILIVWFHTPGAPNFEWGLAGLAYFLLLTFFLQAVSDPDGRSISVGKRARRLLIPWGFWCVCYLLLGTSRRYFLTNLAESPRVLLFGPQIHLWFLPFAFFGSIAGTLLLRSMQRLPRLAPALLLALGAGELAAEAWWQPHWGWPFDQWRYSLPLLCAGLSLGLAQRLEPRWRVTWTILFLSLAGIAWSVVGVPSYCLGMVALAATVPWQSRRVVSLEWLASMSMGVYLMHPGIFHFVLKYAPQTPWYGYTLAGVVVSALISMVIMNLPDVASLALGQKRRPALPVDSNTLGEFSPGFRSDGSRFPLGVGADRVLRPGA